MQKLILIALSNLIAFTTFAQNPSGKIVFTNQAVQLPQAHTLTGLQQLELNNKTNLFITVFMRQPLTAYLQQLAPGISIDSLSKIGNYQFSFFVDDQLIYRTELWPGAPRPQQQQKDTIWTKPLIDNQHEGAWWSQSAWNRFMYNGGDSTLTDGLHTLRLVFRPYVKAPDLKVGDIIAEGRLKLMVKRIPQVDLAGTHLSPLKPYTNLPASVEQFDTNKLKTLKAYIDADVFKHVTSVMVLKNGKILFEEYFNGATRDSLHDVRSVGKTFASALTGMAIRDGHLSSEQQTLGDFYNLKAYKNYSHAKNRVSIKELLTMSSRFNGDDDDGNSPGNEENMYPTDNWTKFTLDLPLDTSKYYGQWHYFTAGVMLLGTTLNKQIPGGLEKYAQANLFKPLHIDRYKWVYTPQKEISLAGGIRMNTPDFAKFGQLYANNGRWNGKQVIPAAWVKESLSHQKQITGRPGEYYGYLFWNKTFKVSGKAYETYYCSGNGGNKIFVFKDRPLVVVITATAYGSGYAHRQADRIVEEFILPAVDQ